MPLPPDVQAAKERMEQAQAALLADIETDGTNPVRRIQLIDELQMAPDDYTRKIGRLRHRPPVN